MSTDFRAITEAGDTRADADQLAMARLRHSLVAALARDRDLLDVACGTGYALPLIARTARSVTGCDRDAANVRAAVAALPSGQIFEYDAERLPFRPRSYDVVACLEAIYYFQDWRGFLGEAHRLLRPGGTLVISWPDPGRPNFDRSPGSTYYPSVDDMVDAIRGGFDGVVYGGFPLVDLVTGRRPLLDAIRRTAVRLHLIPRSLRWRMLLKRLMYRRMRPLSQLTLHPDPFAELVELVPGTSTGVAMLYFVGTKSTGMTAGGRPVTVSVIVPTYNEAGFIAGCLLSVIADPAMEVLVVDGGSTDATRTIVRGLMPRFPGLRLVDNPRRTAASAMNIGLALATGDVIVRLDAHSVYPPDYVRLLTDALHEHDADVSGGVWVASARRPTVFGRAVAASITNPWVMGNTGYRVGGGGVRVVDTVPFGCWRASTLRRAGGYNEELSRSQDFDLSRRLTALGAKIILVPDVVIEHLARSGFRETIRYTFFNGYWIGYPAVASGVRFAARHLVAGAACLAGLALLVAWWLSGSPWVLLVASPYLIVLAGSAASAARHGPAVALTLPVITAATHLLYGFGTLYGLAKGTIARWKRPRPAGEPLPTVSTPVRTEAADGMRTDHEVAARSPEVRPPAGTGVVLVSCTRGEGGGIERYVDTVEAALRGHDGPYARLDLYPSARDQAHGRYDGARRLWTANRLLATSLRDRIAAIDARRLVLAYVNLLPAALWATRDRPQIGITVVLHGNEIWAPGLIRGAIRHQVTRRRVRPVAVSGFSAGALYPLAPAAILHPGLSADWFGLLRAAGAAASPGPVLEIMTSFRLESWQDKGLPEIIEAIRGLDRPDIRLTVCGSGPVPAGLARAVDATPFCSLRSNLTNTELAARYAAADLFVLATRLRRRPTRSGEGFGLVLAEAQVAGTAVVAPAHGGGSDAFRPGITGLSPVDESAAALTGVLRRMTADRGGLARAGRDAAAWAREQFDPVGYADRARRTLL